MSKLKNVYVMVDNDKSMVNLNNVTNIDFNDTTKRIIFNFVSNIEIKVKSNQSEENIQVIADYRYVDHGSNEAYILKRDEITKKIAEMGFIKPVIEGLGHRWVNPDHVTFINVDTYKNRLIFNLANSITKVVKGDVMLVNDFVFWTCNTPDELTKSITTVFSKLK